MQVLYQLSYAPEGRHTIPAERGATAGNLPPDMADTDDTPQHRYGAELASEIEQRWQDRWEADRVFYTPNRLGLLAEDPRHLAERENLFVLDMFPYPSGRRSARRASARVTSPPTCTRASGA